MSIEKREEPKLTISIINSHHNLGYTEEAVKVNVDQVIIIECTLERLHDHEE